MKLLFTSDLHGDAEQYARLVRAGVALRPDVVVLGGDMLADDSALQPAEMGHGQPNYVRGPFRKAIQDFREASGCRHVLFIFGNHDWGSSVAVMDEVQTEGLLCVLNHTAPHVISGVSFLGYSCTPPTPWYVKDFERLDQPGDRPPLLGGARWDPRFTRPASHGSALLFKNTETIAEELATLAAPRHPWVFVAHAPPYGTQLDQAFGPKALGSRAIREVIERRQPMLSLHGHIHESPAVTGSIRDDLGHTVCINAGQSRTSLRYALMDIDPAAGKVRSVERGQQA